MLTGAEPMTPRHQVELISQEIGRSIEVRERSEEKGRAHLSRFVPPRTAAAIAPFAQWVHEHADDFR